MFLITLKNDRATGFLWRPAAGSSKHGDFSCYGASKQPLLFPSFYNV